MFEDLAPTFSWPDLTFKDKLAGILVIAGICTSLTGFIILWQQTNSVQALQEPLLPQVKNPVELAIDVGGAVEKPGIYLLKEGSRVSHVIELAGGFSKTADSYFITHTLNLAKILVDEEKVYIPFKDELAIEKNENNTIDSSSDSLISINTATVAELDSLEGIGEKRAEAIMAARPYTAINELVSKNVISDSLFKSIEKRIKL